MTSNAYPTDFTSEREKGLLSCMAMFKGDAETQNEIHKLNLAWAKGASDQKKMDSAPAAPSAGKN